MLPYKDALNSVLETVQPLTPCEILTADAGGLVLAEAEISWGKRLNFQINGNFRP